VGLVISEDFGKLLPTKDQDRFVSGELPVANGQLMVSFDVECEKSYFLRGVLESQEGEVQYSELFAFSTYEQGLWTKGPNFEGKRRIDPYAFSLASNFYIGGGHGGSAIFNDMHSYSLESQQWETLGEFEELKTTQASGTSLNGKGYVMAGRIDYDLCDLTGNCDCSANPCASAEISSCLLVNCGIFENVQDASRFNLSNFVACDCYNNTLFEYNSLSNTWSPVSEFSALARKSAVLFNTGNLLYYGMGINSLIKDATPGENPCFVCDQNNLAHYNNVFYLIENQNDWLLGEPMPGNGRRDAIQFTIGNHTYIGLGKTVNYTGDLKPNNDSRRIEETFFKDVYSFSSDGQGSGLWTRVEDYPGIGERFAAFSSSSKGYVLSGDKFGIELKFWEFDPSSGTMGSWSNYDLPDEMRGAPEAAGTIANIGAIYLKGSGDNFWLYVPEL